MSRWLQAAASTTRTHQQKKASSFQLSIAKANTQRFITATKVNWALWDMRMTGEACSKQTAQEETQDSGPSCQSCKHRNWYFTSFLAKHCPCHWASSVCACCCCWCCILAWSWCQSASPPMWLHRGGACMRSVLGSKWGWQASKREWLCNSMFPKCWHPPGGLNSTSQSYPAEWRRCRLSQLPRRPNLCLTWWAPPFLSL